MIPHYGKKKSGQYHAAQLTKQQKDSLALGGMALAAIVLGYYAFKKYKKA